jgi:cytochrome P450
MTTAEPTEYDPFEEFNRSAGIGVVEDPYPMFKLARATAPLIREDVRAMAGLEVEGEDQAGFIDPLFFGELPDVFTAFTFDAVQTVLRDGDTFSSKGYEDVMGQVMGHTILEMDEPEHHHYRGIVQQAFSRKTMERWEIEAITPIVDEHIDAFIDRGRAELVRELTFPFPVRVIARLLGLPNSEMAHFHRLAVELISVGFDMDRGLAASQALGDYFGAILAARRAAPADDLMSTLARAELDGQHLTDDEIFAFLRLLLPAGAETTYRSSGNLLFGLLNDPAQLDAVRRDRSLIPQAIEEGLRWEPPLLTILRTATRDTEVEGVAVSAGSMIVINMGSANHDEKDWTDPERFDIFRPQRQHLAFAFGPHMCLGMHLARMETSIVLERLMDRLPNLRLDPEADPPFITGMTFRNPDRLPVVWG